MKTKFYKNKIKFSIKSKIYFFKYYRKTLIVQEKNVYILYVQIYLVLFVKCLNKFIF